MRGVALGFCVETAPFANRILSDPWGVPSSAAEPYAEAGYAHAASRGKLTQRKSFFLLQLRLSGEAELSIILPTPHWKPWYCYPENPGTQPQHIGCSSCERVLEY
jgi:hypothetical protein